MVAAVPILICLLLVAAQATVAGYALWSAGQAAHSGARAALVGGDPERAASSALPEWLEDKARIDAGGPVRVDVAAPALLPGLPDIHVSAGADFDPVAGGVDG